MNITIGQLHDTLTDLEQSWFNKLKNAPITRPALSNGRIQFFAMEMPCPSCRAGGVEETPGVGNRRGSKRCSRCGADASQVSENLGGGFLTFCVGINYDQGLAASPAYIPHLNDRSRGATWVVDNSWSVVRQALNSALLQYKQNSATWYSNGFASASNLLPNSWNNSPYPFTLAMTNLSPFLSLQQWSAPGQKRSGALACWDPNQHLCDLINRLGNEVDLWIVHGIGHVWPTYFKSNPYFRNWIMTPQLGPQPLRLGHFSRFFNSVRAWPHPSSGTWPVCDVEKSQISDELIE